MDENTKINDNISSNEDGSILKSTKINSQEIDSALAKKSPASDERKLTLDERKRAAEERKHAAFLKLNDLRKSDMDENLKSTKINSQEIDFALAKKSPASDERKLTLDERKLTLDERKHAAEESKRTAFLKQNSLRKSDMDENTKINNNISSNGNVSILKTTKINSQEIDSALAKKSYDLDERERALDEKVAEYNEKWNELAGREQKISEREQKISEREQEISKREQKISEREHSLEQRELNNESKAAQIEQDFDRIKNDSNENYKRQLKLNELEHKLTQEADLIRSQKFEKLQTELSKYRLSERTKLDEEIARERKNLMDAVSKEVQDRRKEISEDRDAAMNKIAAEKKSALDEVAAAREKNKQESLRLKQEADKIETSRREVESEKSKLVMDQRKVEYREQKLNERMADWEKELEIRFNGRDNEYKAKINAQDETIAKLRTALDESVKRAGALESAQMVYGDLPVMQKTIDDLRNANEKLREEMSNLSSKETAADCERYKKRVSELEQKVNSMKDDIERARSVNDENETLQRQVTLMDQRIQKLKLAWDESQENLKASEERIARLTASKITDADRENRYESVRQPYLPNPFKAQPISEDEAKKYDELAWLNDIGTLCDKYGVHFPKRILYAFHTSLKIASWSTITVLAGVSGTGKSELPRLYSAFGGINFINVPVQPNWDSQESMLGFFNSIDNKFDAQPMLRFLYQCTHDFSSNMAIVLLDEMNLAHVEHYFADFLSKLESRRSHLEDVPSIDVSLGAGVAPYPLPLSRNVLYCGTMNQDETTKSLSDKVLDRGIVINFPRPRHLIDRDCARNITRFVSKKNINPLSTSIWNTWVEKKINFDGKQREELNRYRGMLEKMNDHLAEVGRAIGHRVWQSIEHYVMNYPDVRKAFRDTIKMSNDKDGKLIEKTNGDLTPDLEKAMRVAVEDQIVQKVMPKLRGIDTNGKSMENCLGPIRKLLEGNKFKLDNDYKRACEMGYGQFMWCSAEYIGDGEEK